MRAQFEDFERARFVNQVFAGMWPYLDATICTAIRNNVEPIIQARSPCGCACAQSLIWNGALTHARGGALHGHMNVHATTEALALPQHGLRGARGGAVARARWRTVRWRVG